MVLLFYVFKHPLDEQISAVCADIEMSVDVLTAMDHHRVAKRCLELVSELYQLAKKNIRDQQDGPSRGSSLPVDNDSEFFASMIDPFLLEDYAFNDMKMNGQTIGVWNGLDSNIGGEGSNALELFLNFTANR